MHRMLSPLLLTNGIQFLSQRCQILPSVHGQTEATPKVSSCADIDGRIKAKNLLQSVMINHLQCGKATDNRWAVSAKR